MRTALLLVLAVAAGCTSRLDSEAPRHYACTQHSDCTDGWACGANGYCFALDAGSRADCVDDSQCATGWSCGFDKKCFDVAVGEALACTEDAHCGGGWKCGAEGRCFDPKVGKALRCEGHDDCGGGWRCGLNGVCYDREKGGAFVCRPDAGGDDSECAASWRCGLEGTCHPLDAGAPYLCGSDDDCEAQWRCSFEGRCVDMRAYALRDVPANGTAAKVSPALPTNADLFSADMSTKNSYVYVDGGTLVLRSGVTERSWALPRGRPTTLVLSPNANAYFSDDAGTWQVSTGTTSPIFFPGSLVLPDAKLRLADGFEPELGIWSGGVAGITRQLSTNTSTVGGGATVHDLNVFPNTGLELNSGCPFCSAPSYLAATDKGMYFAPRGAASGSAVTFLGTDMTTTYSFPVWRPLNLAGANGVGCGTTSPTGVSRIRWQPGASPPKLFATNADESLIRQWRRGSYSTGSFGTCGDLGFQPFGTSCAPCDTGETLLDFNADMQSFDSARTVCSKADGGVSTWAVDFGQACARTPRTPNGSAFVGWTPVGGAGNDRGYDLEGAVFGCPSGGANCASGFYLPPENETRVAGSVDGGLIMWNPFQGGGGGRWLDGFGLVTASTGTILTPAGSVVEAPDLLVHGAQNAGFPGSRSGAFIMRLAPEVSGGGQLTTRLAELDRSDDLVPPGSTGSVVSLTYRQRARAHIATASNGVAWLVVGVDDRIWAAPAAEALDGGPSVAIVPVRTVPLPSAEIESLTVFGYPNATPSDPLLTGYVVAQSRLVRFDAFTATRWVPQEITFDPTAVPLRVFRDQDRARVGTADGRVFALPVPVPISPRLPETAIDYGTICGNAYALTRRALYRLTPSIDGAVGQWQQVPLEYVAASFAASGDHLTAPLHAASSSGVDSLYVFSQRGVVVRLSAQCPP